MGSAQSARRIQLGRRSAVPVRGDLLRGTPSRSGSASAERISSVGGAPRPALGRLGRAGGEGGIGLRFDSLQRLCSYLAASRGRGQSARCVFLGAPRSRREFNRVGLFSVRTRAPRVAGWGWLTSDTRGLRRCRQPTRPVLKHGPRSLTHARVRGSLETPWRNESEDRLRSRWDPGLSGPGAPPARLARSVGEVERERVR